MLDTMKIDIYKTQFRQIHSRYNEDRYIQDTININTRHNEDKIHTRNNEDRYIQDQTRINSKHNEDRYINANARKRVLQILWPQIYGFLVPALCHWPKKALYA